MPHVATSPQLLRVQEWHSCLESWTLRQLQLSVTVSCTSASHLAQADAQKASGRKIFGSHDLRTLKETRTEQKITTAKS